jgi:low affinity Fe/Cu permease
MQIKLDELIRALSGAHNAVVSLEDAEEPELEAVKKRYDHLAALARARRAEGADTGSPELEADAAEAKKTANEAAEEQVRKPKDSRD